MLGTFSQYGVIHQFSTVKIDPDLPLEVSALVGCGVPTGWGAAVNAADVRPGQTVIVYGVGGIGINAVQGARFAGAKHVIAVDPLPLKRTTALSFGATHVTADADEARRIAVDLTRGVGADKAIVAVGTTDSEVIANAFGAVGKSGVVVLLSMGGGFHDRTIQLPAQVATLWKKTVKGSLFGDCNPTTDIPKILGLYQAGDLKLDEIITRTYKLEEVNEGYDDLMAGKNVRGVMIHEH
jgi:S-(hydroxymethyl)glutathione dehydrogenase/alcohol dehydrogenase